MKRGNWLGGAGVAALLLGWASYRLYGDRRRYASWLLGLSPGQFDVQLRQGIKVPMPDGVRLATDHYWPRRHRTAPVILIRTPYGRRRPVGLLLELLAESLAAHGYHVVCQDTRGRFDSEGSFVPFVHEAEDGQATLAWIASQPWGGGPVGMWGASYVGYTQWAAALGGSSVPPRLQALVPAISSTSLARVMENGPGLDLLLRWLVLLDAMSARSQLPAWERWARLVSTAAQDRALAPAWDHLPVGTVDELLIGRSLPFFQEWLQHPRPDDPYWQSLDYHERLPELAAPVHLVSGWFDVFLPNLVDDYVKLQAASRQPYLTIGPWGHIDWGCQHEARRQGLAWFDAHLKGERGRLRRQPVRLYVMGNGAQGLGWREMPAWPPPATPVRFFLQGAGAELANGRLLTQLPPAADPPDYYRFDPADPTPNLGGALLSSRAGQVDNQPLEARPDVLTFTSPPLERPLTVIGPIQLALYTASNRSHTDFFARLCDVQPDGRSLNVCDGFWRVRPGEPPAGDGALLYLPLALSATAYRFAVGHRLRLQVSSGAYPRYARNLGLGEPPATAVTLAPADQTIFHDRERPSHLMLPVVNA